MALWIYFHTKQRIRTKDFNTKQRIQKAQKHTIEKNFVEEEAHLIGSRLFGIQDKSSQTYQKIAYRALGKVYIGRNWNNTVCHKQRNPRWKFYFSSNQLRNYMKGCRRRGKHEKNRQTQSTSHHYVQTEKGPSLFKATAATGSARHVAIILVISNHSGWRAESKARSAWVLFIVCAALPCRISR